MARRSDHSREELHEMALAAAREIVEKDGLRELTARRIAARIGYSAGTLYNLFDDLDDLIVQLNGRSLDSLYAALSNLPLDDDPDAGVHALADGYIKFVAAHPRLWNALFEHQRPEGLIIPDWHHEKISRLLGLVERCLAPLFGPLGDKERLHVARVLWSSLHGICSLESAGRLAASESSTAMAMTLVRHFLAGLRKEASIRRCSNRRQSSSAPGEKRHGRQSALLSGLEWKLGVRGPGPNRRPGMKAQP